MSRDEVVQQRPEDLRCVVPVFHTHNACCGAATAYLLRRIAYRAGAYAPGIQEHMFADNVEPEWTFLVPLGNMGSLQIDGRREGGGFTLTELSTVIRRSAAVQKRADERFEVH